MTLERNTPQSPFDYTLEKVIISLDGAPETIDITSLVTDLEIFEHIDKPYITGTLSFVDTNNVFNAVNFRGGEKLTINIKLPDASAPSIKKVFNIDQVIANVKTNDYTTVIGLHLIEDIAYVSQATNVNKSYFGKPYEIIQQILKDKLGKDLSNPINPDAQDVMRVIIPNKTAIEAVSWVTNRASDQYGMPYYIFSTLTNTKLHFICLSDMLTTNVLNPNNAYTFSQSMVSSTSDLDINQQAFIIQGFKEKGDLRLLDLIKKGVIGANHYFYSPTVGIPALAEFNVENIFNRLVEEGILKSTQKDYIYNVDYTVNDIPLHQQPLKNLTHISTSHTYTDVLSYNEVPNIANYRNMVTMEAMRSLLTQRSLEIVVPGRNFLAGDVHTSIGNQIMVKFLTSSNNEPAKLDNKKTGEHLIYAARHMFKKERYDVVLSCVKLADINDKVALS